MDITIKEVFLSLRKVKVAGGADVVDAGVAQEVKAQEGRISLTLALKGGEGDADALREACERTLEADFPGAEVRGNIRVRRVGRKPAAEAQAADGAARVANIVAVTSGKGGVGKSTVAVNLAAALALEGYRVGLLDADIYGPSVPRMMGVEGERPEVEGEGEATRIRPVERHGVKVVSMGLFVDPSQPLLWRGPMASNALRQILQETEWGELDYLVVDTPPGTGDIHLSLVQTAALGGAVVVTTPQRVATAAAVKGINMFRSESVNVPVLGIVENMAWFEAPELPGRRYHVFGKSTVDEVSAQFGIEVLGRVPVSETVATESDAGTPVALGSGPEARAYRELADAVAAALERRNRDLPPTRIVETR